MIGGGVLAILALGGAGYWFEFSPSRAARAQDAPASEPTPKLSYVDVKEMTMRLSDTSAEHYIKITPVLAVQAKDADDVSDRLAEARDRIIGVVTAHSSTDIVTPQGQTMLKRNVTTALKEGFHGEIVDIYFSEYLVE
jgi:flagellar FliL protein